MHQIFVANPKGGCGKTTLATHIASYYAWKGRSVALMDHDEQCSAMDWLKVRPKSCEPILGVACSRGKTLTEDVDVAVHDLPAGLGGSRLVELAQGHQIVVPILASPTDIKACIRFMMALTRAGGIQGENLELGVVANRIKVQTHYYKTLQEFLRQIEMPLLGSLRDTQNYIRAMDVGVSIFDLPTARLAKDVEQWEGIFKWLRQPV